MYPIYCYLKAKTYNLKMAGQEQQLFISRDERKISLIGGLILTIMTLTAGFSVFVIMQKQTESLLSKSLEVALQNTVQLFEHQIKQGLNESYTIATHPPLINAFTQAQSAADGNQNLSTLKQMANMLLHDNLLGIIVYDDENNILLNKGNISGHHALKVHLQTEENIHAFLLWNQQLILRTSQNILNQNQQKIGSIMMEQQLPSLTQIFTESHLIGETGDFMLCSALKDNDMDCFLRGVDGNEFKRVERIILNKPLPMHHALNGIQGIQFADDYRQQAVVAAHSPMAYGLGTVLKIDQRELHDPITNQLETIVALLAILVLSGLFTLNHLKMPMVRRVIKSEQAMKLANTKIQAAKEEAIQASDDLTACIDAIGSLALISISDRSGRILKANSKFCEISGYSEQELLGQNHRILNSGEHPKSFFVNMWSAIANGHIWHQEICNRNKNGKLYWINTAIVPLRDRSGKITRYLSVRVDITARKQQHRVLKERLKESVCLQAIRNDIGLELQADELCQRTLNHLLTAMQFPGITAAVIDINNKHFTAGKFNKNLTNHIKSHLILNENIVGELRIFYTDNEVFFLPEEQNLLDSVTNALGRWLERQQTEERILQMANHDALTGLPNRRLLQDRIQQVLAHDSRIHAQMAILFIDLDHFKIINDSLGHDIGDLLLKEVATRLSACVRDEDTVARQGGDEFIIVLHSITDSSSAVTVAQKILKKLSQTFIINSEELYIGCSIGISVFPDNGGDSETLLKNSDLAMYHAKQSGRNNYKFFNPEMNQLAEERHILGIDLRYAIERNELILNYQPVISMPGSEQRDLEALLRWQHPKHGLIPPLKFIGSAEETGLIIPIGNWIIKTVCLQIKTWQEQGYKVPRIAINLSAKQFQDDNLVDNITEILDQTDVASKFITLEITETMLIDNIEKVVQTLTRLNTMGIKISIDDFGTGYSSLSYLKRFPISNLKIDRSFVKDINTNTSDNAIVAAIIAMSKSLDISVIAEGVETKKQLKILQEHGCQHFQGYYFSKPVCAEEIASTLQPLNNSPDTPDSKERHLRSIK